MAKNTERKTLSPFEKEVYDGLTIFPKKLPSKYIYNAKGDQIFQEIMAMSSYYLTSCEREIFDLHTKEIAEEFNHKEGFELIELGAGDGEKTIVLLKYMIKKGFDFVYKPIDISEHILFELQTKLKKILPELKVEPEVGEYFEVLNQLKNYSSRKKVILFLGSNIGNLAHKKAILFLQQIKNAIKENDLFFIGMDQKKNPQTIQDAYQDKEGITERFNKNLLERINKELNADFPLDQFIHWETYNPESGTASSFLLAKCAITVNIQKLDLVVKFDPWETVHMEISQKYDNEIVSWLAREAGLKISSTFSDSKGFYKNYILK